MSTEKDIKWIYEGAAVRQNADNIRLFILNLILVLALILTNGAWFYYESQFKVVETTTIEATQDGTGLNILGGGDISYGSESNDNKNQD